MNNNLSDDKGALITLLRKRLEEASGEYQELIGMYERIAEMNDALCLQRSELWDIIKKQQSGLKESVAGWKHCDSRRRKFSHENKKLRRQISRGTNE